ncbi:hypothetical protein C1H46_021228 [Malus baccata]|uniref:Cytochrome P450 CYP749A22-like n=1 Tax=Malus baccata TaxID=106549 RepID=A0A540M311_MALBA|nr:hypothetical protein C1H46_021228 [Malus baccata]
MAFQGIKGPSYRFFHGNTKEIMSMKMESMGRPGDLSVNVFSAVQPHIHTWTKIYGKIYLQWHGSQAQLVVMEPKLCKEILNNKDGAYPKRKLQGFVKKLVGDSMGTSTTEGGKWGKLKKLANHAFHGESLKSMIPAMIASAEMMLEEWKNHEGKEIEIYEQFRLFTSEVISRTAFGSSYIEGKNFFDNLMKLSSLLVKNSLTVRFPGISKIFKTGDEIESEKLDKAMRDSITEIIKKREKKAMAGEENFGSDYLGLLVKAHLDTNDSQKISVDDLVNECKTFYFAGQETTNGVLAWIVFLLALHTDWQVKARKEVLQLFGKQNPTHDDIAKLKTMSMIINEALRLYPPVLNIDRRVKREVKLGKYMVPANVELIIPCLALHHETEFWGQDAQLFKPNRFSAGVAKATTDNIAAFLPFGMGPRSCVGLNFAANEAKIVLSMILQRYRFTLSPGYVHSPCDYLSIRPQHGIQVILHAL